MSENVAWILFVSQMNIGLGIKENDSSGEDWSVFVRLEASGLFFWNMLPTSVASESFWTPNPGLFPTGRLDDWIDIVSLHKADHSFYLLSKALA